LQGQLIMAAPRAAQRYAKAILDLAIEQNKAKETNEDMKLVSNTIASSDDLQRMLASPVVKSAEKKAVLRQVFSQGNAMTIGLFDILIANKRIDALKAVSDKYTVLYDRMNNTNVATVTTAVPLTAELEAKVLAKVKEITGNDVTLENKIDESIIGGFVLRVGDLQYNASIAHKLNTLKREFQDDSYVSQL